MPFGAQGAADQFEEIDLEPHDVGALAVREARRVGRHLHVHAEVDQVHHVLRVGFRLHGPAHVAEGHERQAILHHEAGDDGVERTLARRHNIRAARVERERRAAILEHEAVRSDRRPAAVLAIHAVNQRHHVPPAIRRRQIDRPAVRAHGHAGLRRGVGIDPAAERLRVLF